jgi:hypothetical protein
VIADFGGHGCSSSLQVVCDTFLSISLASANIRIYIKQENLRRIAVVKRNIVVTTILAVLTGGPAAASEPAYKNLPGVKTPEQLADEEEKLNCTTALEEVKNYKTGRKYYIRVYTCTKDGITYKSTRPPLDERRAKDPYEHGFEP